MIGVQSKDIAICFHLCFHTQTNLYIYFEFSFSNTLEILKYRIIPRENKIKLVYFKKGVPKLVKNINRQHQYKPQPPDHHRLESTRTITTFKPVSSYIYT